MVLATLDVSSLYTNIPQTEGIDVICRHYENHYEHNLPIPTNDLRELLRLILEENSFKFNERHFIQTHGVAMGTKTAVAVALLNLWFGNDLFMTYFHCGTFQCKKFPILLTALTRSTLQSSSLLKCRPNALFFLTLSSRFSKDLV